MNRSLFAQCMVWLAYLFVGCFLACSSKEEALTGGGLMVIVESDLSMPKDIDHVRLEATQFGKVLLRKDEEVGAGHLLIPARFSIAYPGNDTPVSIRALAYKNSVARIERSAVTPIPSSRVGVVRMPLDYFCDGTATPDGKSTCGDGQTCNLGTCISSTVPPSNIPPFGAADAGTSGCFDVLPCFATSTSFTPDIATCTFPAPQDVAPGRMNVALQLPPKSDGICDTKACWIVINQGVDGWLLDGARIRLPAVACRPRADGNTPTIAVSSTCGTKTSAIPACGAWSSGGKPTDTGLPPTGSGACGGASSMVCPKCATQTRTCSSGGWSPWSSCLGEGACEPNAVRPCGMGGTEVCAGNCQWGPCLGEPCPGLPTQSCEYCGTQTRTCLNGKWSDWSGCNGQGTCQPNSTEVCGNGGIRVCGGSCQWGACSPICEGPQVQACGNCGTQSRSCSNGTWSDWSACETQGECAPNASQTCGDGGAGTRSCGGDCRWGECIFGPCSGPATEACGNCGTRARVCNNGTWSDWSACETQGVCAPNSMQTCGDRGTRTCGGNCQWGLCTGQPCDGPPTQSCGGKCGTQTRTCSNGTWSPWSTCGSEGECSPNTTEACGNNGTRSCAGDCHWGTCIQICPGASTQACGNCGTQSRVCDPTTGNWSDWGACGAEGPCAPNETRTCGAGGNQSCGGNCQWLPECTGQICQGPSSQDCGSCGKQTRICDSTTGMWSDWGACSGEGVCRPPATQPCRNSGMQTCSASCTWGECGDQMCPGLPSEACGNCGVHIRTCDPNTGNWSDWGDCTGQGACAAGSTQTCGNSGTQTCSSTCQWLPGCSGQMCNGVPPSQTCGNCGTQIRACDPNTGTWTGEWGACMNEGACLPGTIRSCTGGAQTCDSDCQWASCLTIVVTPIDPSIAAGRTQQFVAMGNYAGGAQVNLTSTATWKSSKPEVGTFSSTSAGVATGVSVGTTTVTASYGGTTGTATLNVTAAELVSISVTPPDPTIHVGGTKKFTATGTYTDGSTKDLTTSVSWTSNSPVLATMNASLATGISAGTAVITASLGSVNGTTRLTVSNAPLASIQIAPMNPSIAPGTTQQFTALALYTDGTQLDVTSQVSWSSGNSGVATISATGLSSGTGAGMTTISAALGGVTGSTTLNVTNANLVSIAITPSNPTIASGASIAFTATGTFSDGSTQDITTQAIWSSTNATVARVGTATGVAVGTSSGTATINASMRMVIGSTTLTVTP